MAQSAEEWSKVAFYESVADDENALPELRVVFARKANWLRILARLQAAGLQAHENPGKPTTSIEREALLFSPKRLAEARTNNRALRATTSVSRLLTKRWLPQRLSFRPLRENSICSIASVCCSVAQCDLPRIRPELELFRPCFRVTTSVAARSSHCCFSLRITSAEAAAAISSSGCVAVGWRTRTSSHNSSRVRPRRKYPRKVSK